MTQCILRLAHVVIVPFARSLLAVQAPRLTFAYGVYWTYTRHAAFRCFAPKPRSSGATPTSRRGRPFPLAHSPRLSWLCHAAGTGRWPWDRPWRWRWLRQWLWRHCGAAARCHGQPASRCLNSRRAVCQGAAVALFYVFSSSIVPSFFCSVVFWVRCGPSMTILLTMLQSTPPSVALCVFRLFLARLRPCKHSNFELLPSAC